mmetsp:Transcript_20932/g.46714  ORF Transcript_20932/g.46714 Transcript_20932/m.46714 type:complete len:143 (-) Transcript_20932:273-701(-)
MARNFQEVAKFLEQHYPELRGHISGENYPIPPSAQYAAMAIQFIQLFVIAAVFMGDTIWNFVPFVSQPPDWYYAMKQNGMATVIGMFLILPTLVQRFVTTGAFEILVDGVVVYSKLEVGRMPNGSDILTAMAKAGLKAATTG